MKVGVKKPLVTVKLSEISLIQSWKNEFIKAQKELPKKTQIVIEGLFFKKIF